MATGMLWANWLILVLCVPITVRKGMGLPDLDLLGPISGSGAKSISPQYMTAMHCGRVEWILGRQQYLFH